MSWDETVEPYALPCGCALAETEDGGLSQKWCAAHAPEPEEFPRCVGTIHVWSSIFTFGDACACGRFSLCQGEDGRLRTVDAMPEAY